MKQVSKSIIILIVFCFLSLGLSAAASAQVKEVLIGVLYPLSGINANIGIECKKAVEFAVDVINNKYDLDIPLARTEGLPNLGGAKIKVIFADHENNPQKAMVETERLITREHVVAMYATYGSSVTATSSQTSERLQIPHLNPNSSAPFLTERGFKWFFRAAPTERQLTENLFPFLMDMRDKKGKKVSRIVVIHENTLWGTDSAKVIIEQAPKFGCEILKSIPYDAKTTDLTTEVLLIKGLNPDVLVVAPYIPDSILLMKTLKELDYSPPILIALNGGMSQTEFLNTVGKDAEFIISRAGWNVDLGETRPLIKKVNDLFKKRTGLIFVDDSAKAFQNLFILADAINRAKSTEKEAINKALNETNIPGNQLIHAWNGVQFDEKHQIIGGKDLSIMVQIDSNVEYRLIWPFELKTKDVVWPMPKWKERKR